MIYINREIEMMRYLLDEVEEELDYTKSYREAEELARKELEEYNKKNKNEEYYPRKHYWDFIPDNLRRAPNKSIAKSRMKMVRELALTFYEA